MTEAPQHTILEENKYASCYCPKCNNSWFSDVKPDEKSKKKCPKCGSFNTEKRK